MALQYTAIPHPSRWKSDSSVAFAFRKSDPVLDRIDHLVADYHQGFAQETTRRFVVLCDLFFTLDYWLKRAVPNPAFASTGFRNHDHMEAGREGAIRALYACVANLLCRLFQCTINSLPRELELMFGRELTVCGVKTDMKSGSDAHYYTRKEAELYRIWFKGGLAYQFPWWEKEPGTVRVLAESSRSSEKKALVKAALKAKFPSDNYGFFAMSMSRDIYMTKQGHMMDHPRHDNEMDWNMIQGTGQNRLYHSAYLAGGTAMQAGTMLIEQGVVKRIRPDSGHYQPVDANMVAMLQALQMFSVDLRNVMVETFDGNHEIKALEFLEKQGDWKRLVSDRDLGFLDRQLAHGVKPAPGDMTVLPDPRTVWAKPPLPQMTIQTGHLQGVTNKKIPIKPLT